MMLHRRGLLSAVLATGLAAPALAQTWPDRPLRVIVPFPPGGSNDIIARQMAEALRERLGQPVIVENRAGAGGNVGADTVAKAAPDGLTLLLTAPGPLAINEHLFRSIPFNPQRDFAPVALVASVPIVLMVTNSLTVRSVAELVALAKREPGRLAFGSSGNGSTNHLAGELFKSMAGIEIVHVPYRGAAPAMTDLVGGQIQMMFDNMPAALPQMRGGQVRGLAVAGAQRAEAAPELPTVAESGLPGFDAEAWFGLVAPAATPEAVLQRLQAACGESLADPALRARFAQGGAVPGARLGAAFTAFLAEERAKWGRVVASSGAQAS
ncbi:Bug family tripartite tricarboxylate transporter substrate binding protein [Falsiroseomonas tokyonensis]|uniref:Bug family tripartite tricarboxylate transporter substrate binding protein n=1 Tax=Falsiroseomonas tokyonensis TaxID=430521 RepID=A0ABV7C012_9PROT|nr:tripartite tricarboxylate transporter substrate binding protein [Falsiroseomonas tokyonensis]MBU8541134.1 tripartite tricarboxylate transporter substrate binding protein [Falsiroseomonas tokyonensis]